MTQAKQSETHATGGTPRGSVTKKDMQEFLLECKMMASHNLCCYSANYLMDTPKEGMEEKHAKAVKDCEIVDALIALAEAQDEEA